MSKMLYSVKMDPVPTKSEQDPDSTPPPSDESDPSPLDSSSEPVFIKAPELGIKERTPAARITWHKPVAMTGIFPLTRIELGDVWSQDEEIASMEIAVVVGGWLAALTIFPHYIDYPEYYLRAAMGVLRTQTFMDSTPLRWAKWKQACKTTNRMLYAFIACPECRELRSLSMRNLYSVTNLKRSSVLCADIGLTCGEVCEDVIEGFVPKPSKPASTQGKVLTHMKDDTPPNATSLELVPYKKPEEKADKQLAGEYVTWSQIAPSSATAQMHDAMYRYQSSDPYDAIQAGPEHFISGPAMIKFMSREPTASEISEYKTLESTPLWREMTRDFSKWSDAHKEAQYNGDEDISMVFRWSTAMRARFLNPRVANVIARAELAATTLTYRARSWWLAHRTRSPNLLVTFDQLVEWIKRELVPHSSTSEAVSSWCELTYNGDSKKYITDLERLINHFPLRRESIIIMATRPLGKEIQKRVQLMDIQHGPAGITIAQLKETIKGFLSLSQYSKQGARDREWDRQPAFAPKPFRPKQVQGTQPQYHIHRDNIPSVSREPKPKAAMNVVSVMNTQEKDKKLVAQKTERTERSAIPAIQRKLRIGVGPTPCFVCGTDKHAWIDCPKKKKGKCACCGSEAHLTKLCAQRYTPEVRMAFHTCVPGESVEFMYIPENDPNPSITVDEVENDDELLAESSSETVVKYENVCEEGDEDSNNNEEKLVEELEQMGFHFHMQTMGVVFDQDTELPPPKKPKHYGEEYPALVDSDFTGEQLDSDLGTQQLPEELAQPVAICHNETRMRRARCSGLKKRWNFQPHRDSVIRKL